MKKKPDSQKINPYFSLVIKKLSRKLIIPISSSTNPFSITYNFKLGQIKKIVSFSERESLTKNNGTIINVQLLMVMEKFKFFKNFKKLLMGGHDKKLKNFGKSKKK